MRIDCKTYLEADEIDHLTIRYRRGEPLDRDAAVEKIQYYAACDAAVSAALQGENVSLSALHALSDQALNDLLVRVRTALLDKAFSA